MKRAGLRWRALRPVLLAGAATVTWLTFSSSAAHAEPLTGSPSFLGGVTSSVQTAPGTLASALPSIALPGNGNFSAELGDKGLPQGLAAVLPGTGDDLISSVPLLEGVVGGTPIAGVTEQVWKAADDLIEGTADTVSDLTGSVVEAVAGLEPAVTPVIDQAGRPKLPAADPEPSSEKDRKPVASSGDTVTDAATDRTGGALPDADPTNPATAGDTAGANPQEEKGAPVASAAAGKGLLSRTATPEVSILSKGGTQPLDRSPYPLRFPSPPAGFAPGTCGSAAGLDHADRPYPFRLGGPPPGLSPLAYPLEHVPFPASYDPGSSPD